MKIFRLHIITFLAIAYSAIAYSQINDRANNTLRIPAEEAETEKDSIPKLINIAPNFEASSEAEAEKPKRYTEIPTERGVNMLETDGLRSPGELFAHRWKKDLTSGGVIRTMSDQFLGEHRVDTKFVNIVCRDHEIPDGDRVRIIVNDIIVKPNLLLIQSYRRVEIDLAEGKNIVDIVALNQGDSGPNTAEFIVYNDKGNVVSSKEWNLLTGVKARIVFINEKIPIKEKEQEVDKTATKNEDN